MKKNLAMGLAFSSVATFFSCSSRDASSSDVSAYLAARIYEARADTWFRSEAAPADTLPSEKKCLVKQGTNVEMKGPPRYRTEEEYFGVLATPIPGCDLTQGYLWMPDFPMNYETPPIPSDPNRETRPYLRLRRSGEREADGLEILLLERLTPEGKRIDFITAHSGAASAQAFRVWRESEAGSYEPVPQGEWVLDPQFADNGLVFAASYGDYATTFFETDHGNSAASLGPVFAPVYYRDFNSTFGDHVSGNPRTMIGIHLDAGNPGTAGCIGLRTLQELKTFVGWQSESTTAPRRLLIDWGLSTPR